MKRIAPLALVVLALAVVPAALADTGTPAPTVPAPAGQAGQPQPGRSRADILAAVRARIQARLAARQAGRQGRLSQAPGQGAPAQAAGPQQQRAAGGAGIRGRLELLRLELRLVRLRFALHCRGGVSGAPKACVDFAQKAEQRLQTLDGNVQQKIAELQSCSSPGTDATCKNADKKLALLQKVDTRVQALIQKVQDWLAGTATTVAVDPTSDSSLDQAATGLGQLAQGQNP